MASVQQGQRSLSKLAQKQKDIESLTRPRTQLQGQKQQTVSLRKRDAATSWNVKKKSVFYSRDNPQAFKLNDHFSGHKKY